MQIHLLVRSDKLRASGAMQDRVMKHPQVTVHFNTAVDDAYGDSTLQGLNLVNTKTGGVLLWFAFHSMLGCVRPGGMHDGGARWGWQHAGRCTRWAVAAATAPATKPLPVQRCEQRLLTRAPAALHSCVRAPRREEPASGEGAVLRHRPPAQQRAAGQPCGAVRQRLCQGNESDLGGMVCFKALQA